jgi:protocatechuate 3,4-dioxygenase beta subunit
VKAGVPLQITFNVSQLAGNSCGSLAGAMIDVWHCDALGVYSDASDPSFNTKGKKFLRGYQLTDGDGKATFTTIFPGWYQGRAVHIHFKIRSGRTEFTSQFFFDESLNDVILAQAPYSQRPAANRLRNERDGNFREAGDQMILKPTKNGDQYTASFDVGLQSRA